MDLLIIAPFILFAYCSVPFWFWVLFHVVRSLRAKSLDDPTGIAVVTALTAYVGAVYFLFRASTYSPLPMKYCYPFIAVLVLTLAGILLSRRLPARMKRSVWWFSASVFSGVTGIGITLLFPFGMK